MKKSSSLKLQSGFLMALGVMLVACNAPATATATGLEPVASGLERPLAITHAGDGSGRLFIAQQTGQIRIVENGQLLERPFLDIGSLISCCGERGLLGLAFHPNYRENGLFYVNYTDTSGDTVIARYGVSDDPNVADPASAKTVLTFPQPYGNHNGGQLAFGPDGYLYIGTGDGGSGGDPQENGQSLATFLGKILRIDVDGGDPYAVPADNPFVTTAGAKPEIWAYGLRNPWRFSFDRETGDLWIADVGQNAWEEIDLQPAGSEGGENYGWDVMEGAHCFEPEEGCDREGLVLPVLEYNHSQGRSITGGYRYRGEAVPGLKGTYLFGDYGSGRIWGATRNEDGGWSSEELLKPGFSISTFGEDEAGELYVTDYGGGVIYRFVAQ